MRKKKYSQKCELSGFSSGSKRTTRGLASGASSKKISKREINAVFTKYYKDQVANLYKAVQNS